MHPTRFHPPLLHAELLFLLVIIKYSSFFRSIRRYLVGCCLEKVWDFRMGRMSISSRGGVPQECRSNFLRRR